VADRSLAAAIVAWKPALPSRVDVWILSLSHIMWRNGRWAVGVCLRRAFMNSSVSKKSEHGYSLPSSTCVFTWNCLLGRTKAGVMTPHHMYRYYRNSSAEFQKYSYLPKRQNPALNTTPRLLLPLRPRDLRTPVQTSTRHLRMLAVRGRIGELQNQDFVGLLLGHPVPVLGLGGFGWSVGQRH
jgi:hypothetical protein